MRLEYPYGLVQTVAPTIEPVAFNDIIGSAQTWSRDPSEENQATVELLIKAAREKVEIWTGLQLLTATWALTLDWFPSWEIELPGKGPWISVTSITYIDTLGDQQTVSAADYRLDTATGRIEPVIDAVWPTTEARIAAVTITFTAGFGTAPDDVPAGLRLAILATVLDWLENRALRFDLPPGVRGQLREFADGRYLG